jgi:hypothetical protein
MTESATGAWTAGDHHPRHRRESSR